MRKSTVLIIPRNMKIIKFPVGGISESRYRAAGATSRSRFIPQIIKFPVGGISESRY